MNIYTTNELLNMKNSLCDLTVNTVTGNVTLLTHCCFLFCCATHDDRRLTGNVLFICIVYLLT